MTRLVFLGTAHAVPDEMHENSHMLLVGDERSLLIDCSTNPIVRLRMLGLDVDNPTDMLLTHFHPDHVAGVPSYLLSSWLMGRKRALNIYALAYTLERLQVLMDLYEWETWLNFYTVNFIEISPEELTPFLVADEFRVFSSPVKHVVPNIGLRVEFQVSGKVLAYSSDTQPCQEVVRLAQGADVLVHEATGEFEWHSSAVQAGNIARLAGVKQLYLIHYSPGGGNPVQLIDQARETFDGPVHLAEDLMSLDF
jgi:ribonuclease Z